MLSLLLIVARVLAGLYAPITDCDETFNYLEPLHYLQHHVGLQTWEYVPSFAIRSYAFLLFPYSFLLHAAAFFTSNKMAQFYALRVCTSVLQGLADLYLVRRLHRHVSLRHAVLFSVLVTFASGYFIASPAILPSSFAMLCTTFFLAEAIPPVASEGSFVRATLAIAFASLWGWPFAAAFAIPYYAIQAISLLRQMSLLTRWGKGLGLSLLVLATAVSIDSLFYYKRLQIVPWNIVRYNLFASDAGPALYGTEPASYYVRNGLLNFNLALLAALLSPVMFFVAPSSIAQTANMILPFWTLFCIFSLQPHKEERFLSPAYPSLLLATTHVLLGAYQAPVWAKSALVAVVSLYILISGARNWAMVTHYDAPFATFAALPASSFNQTVCIGEEWYRFPSHYFLPEPYRLRWLPSSFDGALPQYFQSYPLGIYTAPEENYGFNHLNLPPPKETFTSLQACDYLVTNGESERTRLSVRDVTLSVVHCSPLLDKTATTHPIARILGIPRSKRVWTPFCLYQVRHQ